MKDTETFIKETFTAIKESEATNYAELIDYLQCCDEWSLVMFVLENGEMFERYFESKMFSLLENGEYAYGFEDKFTNESYEELCCVNSIPANNPGDITGVVYGLMDWGADMNEAIDAAAGVKAQDPTVVWEKVNDEMKDGIYFIIGAKWTNSSFGFAGTYAKCIDGRWTGYFEEDDTSDHLCGLTPVAYDANDIMGLDEEERFLEETGGGLKTLSE